MRWIRQSVWVADLCLLAMLAFFIVLGGVDLGESSGLAIVLGAMALVAIAHSWWQRGHLTDVVTTRAGRFDRERRGF